MSEKRFPASTKKLLEAKARGDIPRAPLLTRSAALLGALLALSWQLPKVTLVFTQTSWFDWSVLWWENASQLLFSLFVVLGSSAGFSYAMGSLAGGFVFSGPLTKERASIGVDRMALLSMLCSWASLGVFVYSLLWGLSSLSWLPSIKNGIAPLFDSLSFVLLLVLGVALVLGAGQATLAWYFWNQRHRRSYQEWSQDTKDEEGQAKRFFLGRLNKR